MKSNRRQHLAANRITASGLLLASLIWPPLVVSAAACFAFERWASPDRDLDANRKLTLTKLYWSLYAALIPGHRSRLSHSAPVGTAFRFFYGFWWLSLFPLADWVWLYACLGAMASDATHLFMDGYAPHQVLLGRR